MIKFNMPARDVVEAFRFALSCAGVKDIRYYLNGVALELTDGVVRWIGLDGHRQAVVAARHSPDVALLPNSRRVVSRVAVAAFLKSCTRPGADDVAEFEILPEGVVVVVGPLSQTLAVIPDARDRYPDWQRSSPGMLFREEVTPAKIIGMNAEYVADAAKACARLANSKYKGLKVRGGDGYWAPSASGICFEPGICEADFRTLESAYIYVMPMRL